MLVAEAEVIQRVESPLNLLNRLRELSHTSHKTPIPTIPPPKTEDLIPNIDEKLATKNSQDKALSVMNKALHKLDMHVEELEPKRLTAIIRDMSQTIKNLEPERDTILDNKIQVVVYSPRQSSEEEFEVIESKE